MSKPLNPESIAEGAARGQSRFADDKNSKTPSLRVVGMELLGPRASAARPQIAEDLDRTRRPTQRPQEPGEP